LAPLGAAVVAQKEGEKEGTISTRERRKKGGGWAEKIDRSAHYSLSLGGREKFFLQSCQGGRKGKKKIARKGGGLMRNGFEEF